MLKYTLLAAVLGIFTFLVPTESVVAGSCGGSDHQHADTKKEKKKGI